MKDDKLELKAYLWFRNGMPVIQVDGPVFAMQHIVDLTHPHNQKPLGWFMSGWTVENDRGGTTSIQLQAIRHPNETKVDEPSDA